MIVCLSVRLSTHGTWGGELSVCVWGEGTQGRRVYVHMCLYFGVCLYSVCVCVCVRARVRACVRIFVHNSVMKYK